MSSRLDALETRRQALLNRCEEQRLEVAYRITQLSPRAALTAWTHRRGAGAGAGIAKSLWPWLGGIASLFMMLRRRRRPSTSAARGVGLATGLVGLAMRTTTILRVLAQLRALYLTYRATKASQR
jgi:hypothetical protein